MSETHHSGYGQAKMCTRIITDISETWSSTNNHSFPANKFLVVVYVGEPLGGLGQRICLFNINFSMLKF